MEESTKIEELDDFIKCDQFNYIIKKDYVYKNDYLGKGYYKEKFFEPESDPPRGYLEDFFDKFKLFWQYPVITEQTFYKQNYKNENYFPFPWATIIDKRYDLNLIYKLICENIDIDEKNYFTCVQHISFRDLIPLFKKLNITTVYTPHKVIGEDCINNINLFPCPLYAISYEEEGYRSAFLRDKSTQCYSFSDYDLLFIERHLLFSFVGAFNKRDYLSDIREKIFSLEKKDNIYIENTGSWHFDPIVYSSMQNFKKDVDQEVLKKKNIEKNASLFSLILLGSRFSLCPSGSGPNSIRLWESLAYGSIPVLLSDTLELPEHNLWNKAIVRIKEKDLDKIYEILEKIDKKTEDEMRKNCLEIYKRFRKNFINN